MSPEFEKFIMETVTKILKFYKNIFIALVLFLVIGLTVVGLMFLGSMFFI